MFLQIERGIGMEEYKKKIIEMVEKIEDNWILEQIYRCILNMIKEG